MRKTILLGVVALAIVATACTIDTGAQRSSSSPAVGQALFGTQTLPTTDEPVATVASQALPAVVNVTSDIVSPSGQSGQGVGTGFIVRSDGVVVTNCHVVEGASKITVFTSAEKPDQYDARVIGGDCEHDLAVLKTDAAINHGNSGGPLLNLEGQVVGINSAGSDNAQNIGFAIAIDSAKDTIQQAIDSPLAPTGYMGVFTETVNSAMAYQLGLKVDTGAYVVSTSTGGPADTAGIQSGDVIVRVDDSAVNTAEDLGSILNDLQPGPDSGRGPGGDRRQPVPLHRVSEHRRLRAAGGRDPARRVAMTTLDAPPPPPPPAGGRAPPPPRPCASLCPMRTTDA